MNEILKGMSIRSWEPYEASMLYEVLEHPNWAPWLEAGERTIEGRALVFPKGQLLMTDRGGKFAASLSLNQIDWDGVIGHLPTWDEVAGDPTDYSTTYKTTGNTLVLLSMNVADQYKGLQLPTKMIHAAIHVAHSVGATNLIGSFRPSGFGHAKSILGYDIDFETYCLSKQDGTEKPVDPWLRSLSWNGMKMLAVDPKAMTVSVSLEEFGAYKSSYKPDQWVEVTSGLWECNEVGSWAIDYKNGIATYQESNMWGALPLK